MVSKAQERLTKILLEMDSLKERNDLEEYANMLERIVNFKEENESVKDKALRKLLALKNLCLEHLLRYAVDFNTLTFTTLALIHEKYGRKFDYPEWFLDREHEIREMVDYIDRDY